MAVVTITIEDTDKEDTVKIRLHTDPAFDSNNVTPAQEQALVAVSAIAGISEAFDCDE